ncbi:MAG: sugar ABC transporter permease [Actinobacteria bacterium 13_1_20CM_4_69_9]|nr:MAG: sugar ABC transporter permease [Actinobacteria bacterium 13_1_20CM_4_69_9]
MSSVTQIAPTPVAPAVTRPRSRKRLRKAGWNVLGLVVLAVMVFPVYWMVSTAFKPGHDILSYTPQWIPTHPVLSNFTDAIHQQFFWNAVKNSLIVTTVVVVLSLVLAFLAALALAKFSFYGRKPFIVVILGVQMVPLAALIIPLYILMSRVHQVDKLSGVIVMYLTFVLPFAVWTLRGFLLGVPKELEESAMVDGATRFGAFVRILLPLLGPGLVATSIFAFIQAWNEFIIAYVFLHTPEKQTLMVWLASFTTLRGTDWGPLMAGATLCSLPVIVFFVLVQRKIAFGLTAGAVKG